MKTASWQKAFFAVQIELYLWVCLHIFDEKVKDLRTVVTLFASYPYETYCCEAMPTNFIEVRRAGKLRMCGLQNKMATHSSHRTRFHVNRLVTEDYPEVYTLVRLPILHQRHFPLASTQLTLSN